MVATYHRITMSFTLTFPTPLLLPPDPTALPRAVTGVLTSLAEPPLSLSPYTVISTLDPASPANLTLGLFWVELEEGTLHVLRGQLASLLAAEGSLRELAAGVLSACGAAALVGSAKGGEEALSCRVASGISQKHARRTESRAPAAAGGAAAAALQLRRPHKDTGCLGCAADLAEACATCPKSLFYQLLEWCCNLCPDCSGDCDDASD